MFKAERGRRKWREDICILLGMPCVEMAPRWHLVDEIGKYILEHKYTLRVKVFEERRPPPGENGGI